MLDSYSYDNTLNSNDSDATSNSTASSEQYNTINTIIKKLGKLLQYFFSVYKTMLKLL